MPNQSAVHNSRNRKGTGRWSAHGEPSGAELELVRAVVDHGAVPVDLLAAFAECSVEEIRSWVRKAEGAKWLRSTEYAVDEYEWVLPCKRGAGLVGRRASRRDRPNVGQLDHRRKIFAVRLLLREEKPEWEWICEREFRNGGGTRVPDGVLSGDGERWVIEVEISKKTPAEVRVRLRELLRECTSVVYFCSARTRAMLEDVQASGEFEALYVRPLPGEKFEWERYEASSEAERLLGLLSEEGMVPESRLGALLGWGSARAQKVVDRLERQGCVSRAVEVNGAEGWVSCTERGNARSGTGLPHFCIPGRYGLERRSLLTEIQVDVRGRHEVVRWTPRRVLTRELGWKSGVPSAAVEMDGRRVAVVVLEKHPVRDALAERLRLLCGRFDAVLCYRTSRQALWMADFAAFVSEHRLGEVALCDLPESCRSAQDLSLEDERGIWTGHDREVNDVRALLREEEPKGVWVDGAESETARSQDASVPDGVLALGDERWAVEVELSSKAHETLWERLKRSSARYDRVVCFCSLPVYRQLMRIERLGEFSNLEVRLSPQAMRLHNERILVRSSYEPSAEGRELLRVVNEDGLVAVAQLPRLLGWRATRVERVLGTLEAQRCLRRGLEVNADGGWVWCTDRGAVRSGTGLAGFGVRSRGELAKRFAMTEVRLDVLERWSGAVWVTRRMLVQAGSRPPSDIPRAVVQRGDRRYAVILLESTPRSGTLALLKKWKKEYSGVLCYRADRVAKWAQGMVERHGMEWVEFRDLPQPPSSTVCGSLQEEWRSGYELYEPGAAERRLLELTALEGLLWVAQLPRLLGCDEEGVEELVSALVKRGCLQRRFEDEWSGGWIMCTGRGMTLSGTGLARAKAPKSDCLEERFELMEIRLATVARTPSAVWRTRRELAKGLTAHAGIPLAAVEIGGERYAVGLFETKHQRAALVRMLSRWGDEYGGVVCFCREGEVDAFRGYLEKNGLGFVRVAPRARPPVGALRGRHDAMEEAARRGRAGRAVENRERLRAYRAVDKALRDGTMERPPMCESGCAVSGPAELRFSHSDLRRPLEGTWLCRKCRRERRRDMARRARGGE